MSNSIGIYREIKVSERAPTGVYTEAPRGVRFVAWLRASLAFVRVVMNPNNLTQVIRFVDALTSLPVVSGPLVEAMRGSEQGRRALETKVRFGRVDIEALAQCPPGSLGQAFASYLKSNGLDPSALPARKAVTDAEYVSAHLYETHDIWHVVTGFQTDVAGELGLQAVYAAQLPSRVAVGILAIGMVQTLFKGFADREARFEQIVRGWQMGRRAAPLIGFDWRSMLNAQLLEVRQQLGLG